MDTIAVIYRILRLYTYLVAQPPAILRRNGPMELRISSSDQTLMTVTTATVLNLALVTFPGIAVGVKLPDARLAGHQITRLLGLRPELDQTRLTALEATGYLSRKELDLVWRLRLMALGHLVNGWKLSGDGKEVAWELPAHATHDPQRDRARALAMVADSQKRE